MIGTRFSVLLVDDDPDTHNLFQMVMDHYHHELVIVKDAEAAISYLKANTPDIIVMDIFLPGIDGYQALHQIRKNALAPNCSVVATTAYYTSDTRDEVLSRGFSGYLPKPLNTATLVTYLEEMIKRRTA
jgi:two-component system, cell cycle response regulator DivK